MDSRELKGLRALQAENLHLKPIVTRRDLEIDAYTEIARVMVSPAAKRQGLGHLMARGVFRRRGCRVVGLSRNGSRRERRDRLLELRAQILAHSEATLGSAFAAFMRCWGRE